MNQIHEQSRKLTKQLKEQQDNISATRKLIEILSNGLKTEEEELKIAQATQYKLLDKLQHPAYLQLVKFLDCDSSNIVVDYLNYKYCSKCCKIYYGSICLNHYSNTADAIDYNLSNSLTNFVSQGNVIIAKNRQDGVMIGSSDQNEDDYLKYLFRYKQSRFITNKNNLTIYSPGITFMKFWHLGYSISGPVIKQSCYISNEEEDICLVMDRILKYNYNTQVEYISLAYKPTHPLFLNMVGYTCLEYLHDKYRTWWFNTPDDLASDSTGDMSSQTLDKDAKHVKFINKDAVNEFNIEDFEACFKAATLHYLRDDVLSTILKTPLPKNFQAINKNGQTYSELKTYEELFSIISYNSSFPFENRTIRCHPQCLTLSSKYNNGVYHWEYLTKVC